MKKIAFVLAVLLFAAPAWATTVTIDACDIGGGQVEISYVSDGNLPRAFGLDITVSDGNITACEPNMVGECTVSVRGFGIFPGTIVIVDGIVTDYNTPVAPSDDPGALGGIDTNGITIEMGSLYQEPNAPGLSGVLCTITVTEDCTVSIAGNAARCGTGSPALGVVMENPDEVITEVYVSGEVVIGCFPSGHPDYQEWLDVGEPNSWCYPRQCHGDADGLQEQVGFFSYYVAFDDLAILLDAWQASSPTEAQLAADFDHASEQVGFFTYRVAFNDLAVFLANWQSNPAPDCLDVP